MKKRTNMYIFAVTAFLLTFSIVRVSAYSSLEFYKYAPEIAEHSLFIQLALGR